MRLAIVTPTLCRTLPAYFTARAAARSMCFHGGARTAGKADGVYGLRRGVPERVV